MSSLSRNQIIVLRHMTNAMKPGGQLTVRDFEEVATVDQHRERWASAPLSDLRKRGMVEMCAPTQGARGNGWRITMRGMEALFEARARLAGKNTQAARALYEA